MEVSPGLKGAWNVLGKADKTFLFALAAYLISGWLVPGSPARLFLLFALIAAAAWTTVKWMRIGTRKAIWRLRNRLLVAYLYIAVVPVLLIGIFLVFGTGALVRQVAVYLVSSEFDRRAEELEQATQSLAMAPPFQRDRTWERTRSLLDQRLPGLQVVIEERGVTQFSPDPVLEPPPDGWGETGGAVVRNGMLYIWARAISGETQVTTLAPLTHTLLNDLAPGVGEVTILDFTEPMRLHDPVGASSAFPPPRNRLDFDVTWGVNLNVAVWRNPPATERALLSVRTRVSAVMAVLFSQQAETASQLAVLYLMVVIFLIVEIIALFVGVSITRTITAAVHDLYEGTEHVRAGDFSHRIEVTGDDQLASVSRSFNRMTENLESLLVVAKEKERLQTELEIAREVQRQLYPKSVPHLKSLELRAQCHPARMVSGDYYDYQALREGCAVVAIGDVAGKGISAALLMASLQSSLRTQVRACVENGARDALSTSRLVGQLNQLLYADTAPEKFATFLFSIYDDETGTMTYTNAGHLPPVLIRGGQATPLDVNGMVVGAFPFAEYGESQLRLEAGDLLLCYTDGVTEPENEYGEMFGEERLTDIVIRNAHLGTDQIIAAVMSAVQDWTGTPELQDDMTLLLARRH